MSKTMQAARPHQPPSPNGGQAEVLLDQQLGALTKTLEQCLTKAKAFTPDSDEFGYRATAEVVQAMKIAEMSGKLIKAKARLRGELKFQYNVVRTEVAAAAAVAAEPEYEPTPVDPDMPQMTDEEWHSVDGTARYEMRLLTYKIKKMEQDTLDARARLAELEEDLKRWNALTDEQKAFRKKLAEEGHPLPPV
jgi:hypothetical protein